MSKWFHFSVAVHWPYVMLYTSQDTTFECFAVRTVETEFSFILIVGTLIIAESKCRVLLQCKYCNKATFYCNGMLTTSLYLANSKKYQGSFHFAA